MPTFRKRTIRNTQRALFVTMPDAVRWSVDRGVTGAEMVHGPLMAWWAIAIWVTPHEQLSLNPLYAQMLTVMPRPGWIIATAGMALLMAFGIWQRMPRVSEIAFVITAAFWSMIGSFVYLISHTPLTTSVYIVIAASALWRYADIATARRIAERRRL